MQTERGGTLAGNPGVGPGRRGRVVVAAALLLVATTTAPAQEIPDWVQIVPGTAVTAGGQVGTPAFLLGHEGVSGIWFPESLVQALPPGVEIDAATVFSDQRQVFSFDSTLTLNPGNVTACDEDVVLYDPASGWLLLFDGSANGLSDDADIDAVHVDDPGPPLEWCLLSFRETTTVGGVTYRPGDIVRWDNGVGFSLEAGVTTVFGPGAEDVNVDGLALIDQENLMLSVAEPWGSPAVGGADLLRWDGTSLWLMVRMEAWDFPESGVGVQAVDVWYQVSLAIVGFTPAVVSTAGPVTVDVYVTDHDGEPVAAVQCRSAPGEPWVDIEIDPGCGNQYCDGSSRNGEIFSRGSLSFPAGVSSTLECRATDGTGWQTNSEAGPGWVSEPGDADGDGDVDASDVARIIAENDDDNTTPSIGHVRTGHMTDSWGGTDANWNNGVGTDDVPVVVSLVMSS